MTEIGKKIREVRKQKGLSQEELAELAKINLRTIQRIESNISEPRGKTLNLICEVLDLNTEDVYNYGKHNDTSYLVYFHLSVLVGLVIPTGNIIIPLILWMTQKDKIIGLKEVGANLLNFQIFWTFLTFSSLLLGAFFRIIHFDPGSVDISFYLTFWATLYITNIILPIVFAFKTKNRKIGDFYPTIIKLIK